MPKRILVLGAGSGGTMTANSLAKKLSGRIRARDVSVEVLAENNSHIFQPGNLNIAFAGANPASFTRKEAGLLDRAVKFTIDGASRIDLDANEVMTKSGKKINYDYIVIATGSVADPTLVKGLEGGALNFHTGPEDSAKVWEALKGFRKGTVAVAVAGVPHKCPPTPNEAVFLLDQLFRKRGVRKDVRIRLVTPYARSYPAAAIAESIEPLLKEKGIEEVTLFNVSHVDAANRKIYSLEGEETDYDLLIVIPPHRGADVVMNSGIGDKDGWIPVDKYTMRISGRKNAYSIGDATNLPVPKTGVVADLQSQIVANNIASLINGGKELEGYNGRINCPMEIGDGKGLFVVATYSQPAKKDKPTFIKYLMKKAFGMMYWQVVRGRFRWLLEQYFGKVSTPLQEVSEDS